MSSSIALRPLAGAASAVYLPAMTNTKYEDHHFRIAHFIDHPVITNPDSHFSGAALELLATMRTRIGRQ